MKKFSNIVIIGLGLIGASLAGAIKKNHTDVTIVGVDTDKRTRNVALELGLVDISLNQDDSALVDFLSNSADLVVICTPVGAVDGYLQLIADSKYAGIVTDTISTKAHILESAKSILLHPDCYIPGHPMCGSEQNGIDGARADLFEGSNWILCPSSSTNPDQFQQLHEFITGLSARVVSISPESHDESVAIVSHVPHMVAASLVKLAANHADDNKMLMRLAAGGFKDTTRVAAGSPKLWTGIAFDNASALSQGLTEIEQIIATLRETLESGSREDFARLLKDSADVRRSLPAEWVPSSDKLLEVRIPMINRSGVIAEVATIASSVGCNIQSIDIDHISEGNAVLSLLLTDEGDIGQLSIKLLESGYTVSFRPIEPKEHAHV